MYGDALTTKARIKERLGITVATFDALIDRLILAVTARICAICDRRFNLATYTNELHDGSDLFGSYRTFLIAKNAPIQTVTSIEYKAGSEQTPLWTAFSRNDYTIDALTGMIRFRGGLPRGHQNIRITYMGGYSGYSIGIDGFWVFNATPTGAVNGANLTFTLPVNASQIIVYADGAREASSNLVFTPGTSTFSFVAGRAPASTIAVDYNRGLVQGESDYYLPADLVEVCEAVVIRLFKRRDSEGRDAETFQESSITWGKSVFTEEDRATVRNYRRGYYL